MLPLSNFLRRSSKAIDHNMVEGTPTWGNSLCQLREVKEGTLVGARCTFFCRTRLNKKVAVAADITIIRSLLPRQKRRARQFAGRKGGVHAFSIFRKTSIFDFPKKVNFLFSGFSPKTIISSFKKFEVVIFILE